MSNRPARTGPGLPAAAREAERPVQNPSWQESNAGHEKKQGPLSEESYVESKAVLVAHIEFIGWATRPDLDIIRRLSPEQITREPLILRLGGFDALLKPFEPKELLHCITAAW